jgi:hypothetical protein
MEVLLRNNDTKPSSAHDSRSEGGVVRELTPPHRDVQYIREDLPPCAALRASRIAGDLVDRQPYFSEYLR